MTTYFFREITLTTEAFNLDHNFVKFVSNLPDLHDPQVNTGSAQLSNHLQYVLVKQRSASVKLTWTVKIISGVVMENVDINNVHQWLTVSL
jgi:hypothetical protein